jgi:Uma2 family endonuclease
MARIGLWLPCRYHVGGSDTKGHGMVTIVAETGKISVPAWIVDLESFRRWVDTEDLPEEGKIWWLRGDVWADMSREIFTHNALRTEITSVLHLLTKTQVRGRVFSDGLLLSNFAADFSGHPDATFLLEETLGSDRVRLIEGKEGGYVELQGAPDMVLEVVSRSSEQKDTVTMREAYWDAGIREYWLADARRELRFEILRHTSRGHVATRKQDGWVKSAVFGKAFRLRASTNPQGHPIYELQVK